MGLLRKKADGSLLRVSSFVQLGLGVIFIYASYGKMIDPPHFYSVISQYQVVSLTEGSYLAVILPWVEMGCGILLLLGCFVPSATYLVCVCLSLFTGAQLAVLTRGYAVDCGCLAPRGAEVTWLTVARNILLLAACLFVLAYTYTGSFSRNHAQKMLALVSVTFLLGGVAVAISVLRQAFTYPLPTSASEFSVYKLDVARSRHRPVLVIFLSDNCEYCPCLLAGPLKDRSLTDKLRSVECLVVHSRKVYDEATSKRIKTYAVSIYPSLLLIGSNGRVESELLGYHTAQDIARSINNLMAHQRQAKSK